MSGNVRVGLPSARFSPGEGIWTVPAGVTSAYVPKTRNSGPLSLVWLTRAGARSRCRGPVVLLPEVDQVVVVRVGRRPVRVNGVRIGMVLSAGAVTIGAWLAVVTTVVAAVGLRATLGGRADEAGDVTRRRGDRHQRLVDAPTAEARAVKVTWKPLVRPPRCSGCRSR